VYALYLHPLAPHLRDWLEKQRELGELGKLGKQRRLATIPVSLLWLDFEVGVSSISGLSSIVYRSWQFHQVMNPER
jgi:hypothetical protein